MSFDPQQQVQSMPVHPVEPSYGYPAPPGYPAAMPQNMGYPIASGAAPAKKKTFNPFYIILGLCLCAILMGSVLVLFPPPAKGFEVWLGSRQIGIVQNSDALMTRIEQQREIRSAQYGIDVQFVNDVTLKPILLAERNCFTDIEDVIQAFDTFSDIQVEAAAIIIDGNIAAATHSLEDSQWVIDQLLSPYEQQKERGRIEKYELIETVEVANCMVPASIVSDKENIYQTLVIGTNEVKTHTVQKSDSIHSIAKETGISLIDIKRANPRLLTSDVVKEGEELNLVAPRSQLNVRYYRMVNDTIPLPYKTEVELDEKKYKTQKSVLVEGVQGLQKVVALQEYVGGVMTKENILEQQTLTQAVNQVISKGTKEVSTKVSKSSGTAVSKNVSTFVEGAVSSDGFSWPVTTGRLSSTYGERWNALHAGIDIATPRGTPVYASRSGTVIFSGTQNGYGKLVTIDHGNGYQTRYAHNDKLLKVAGDKVERGELISLSGNTGRSTGPHVHFEIRVNNSPKNPLKMLPALE